MRIRLRDNEIILYGLTLKQKRPTPVGPAASVSEKLCLSAVLLCCRRVLNPPKLPQEPLSCSWY